MMAGYIPFVALILAPSSSAALISTLADYQVRYSSFTLASLQCNAMYLESLNHTNVVSDSAHM